MRFPAAGPRGAGARAALIALSRVQLHDVAIGNAVLRTHPLAVEGATAPQARELESAGNVLMHEPRDIEHGVAATHRERHHSLAGPPGPLRPPPSHPPPHDTHPTQPTPPPTVPSPP